MFIYIIRIKSIARSLKTFSKLLCCLTIFSGSLQAAVVNFDLTALTFGSTNQTLSGDSEDLELTLATNDSWDGTNPGIAGHSFNGLVVLPQFDANITMTMTFSFNKDVRIIGYVFSHASFRQENHSATLSVDNQSIEVPEPVVGSDFESFSTSLEIAVGKTLSLSASKTIPTPGPQPEHLQWSSLRVETIPEPSTYVLLAGLGASILCLRRFLKR